MTIPKLEAIMILILLFHQNITLYSQGIKGEEDLTIQLYHQEFSSKSSSFNESETQYDRFFKSVVRSIKRIEHVSITRKNGGEMTGRAYYHYPGYFMYMGIGTPPVHMKGFIDTGSNLIWTQCKECIECLPLADPLFDPSKSSTYREISCDSKECFSMDGRCDPDQGRICQYHVGYKGGDYSEGNVARETITLSSTTGEPLSFGSIVIGCGHKNRLTHSDNTYSGVIGFGSTQLSLVNQLDHITDGKFSYCLLPFLPAMTDKSSSMNFGRRASVSGPDVACTPMVLKSPGYYITLKGITVNNKMMDSKDYIALDINMGNIMVDSGSSISVLDQDTYFKLEDVVSKQIHSPRVSSPEKFIKLCYRSKAGIDDAPSLTFHFDKADVQISSESLFYEVAEEVWCFTFAPALGPVQKLMPMYGAVHQTNLLVGYDLKSKTICFKPMNCANLQM